MKKDWDLIFSIKTELISHLDIELSNAFGHYKVTFQLLHEPKGSSYYLDQFLSRRPDTDITEISGSKVFVTLPGSVSTSHDTEPVTMYIEILPGTSLLPPIVAPFVLIPWAAMNSTTMPACNPKPVHEKIPEPIQEKIPKPMPVKNPKAILVNNAKPKIDKLPKTVLPVINFKLVTGRMPKVASRNNRKPIIEKKPKAMPVINTKTASKPMPPKMTSSIPADMPKTMPVNVPSTSIQLNANSATADYVQSGFTAPNLRNYLESDFDLPTIEPVYINDGKTVVFPFGDSDNLVIELEPDFDFSPTRLPEKVPKNKEDFECWFEWAARGRSGLRQDDEENCQTGIMEQTAIRLSDWWF